MENFSYPILPASPTNNLRTLWRRFGRTDCRCDCCGKELPLAELGLVMSGSGARVCGACYHGGSGELVPPPELASAP